MFCGDEHLVKDEGHRRSVHKLWCRSWSCDDCAPMRRWGVIKLADEGKGERLITLTMRPRDGFTADQDARFMAKSWAQLLRWMKARHGGQRVQCLRIFEAHKSGRPHLHVIHRGDFVPIADLKAKWEELTGSWNVDIKFIAKSRNVARYVSKYIGKDVHAFEGVKRYYYTRGWIKSRAEKRAERDATGVSYYVTRLSPIELAAQWAVELGFVDWVNGSPVGLRVQPP